MAHRRAEKAADTAFADASEDALGPQALGANGDLLQTGPGLLRSDGLLVSLAIFLLPALIFVDVRIVGQLFLPEAILIALLPALALSRGHQLMARLPRTTLVLGGLWLASQILTDVYRNAPFEDWSRGWAKIGLFLLEFAAFYLLLRGSRSRMLLVLAGLAIGQLFSYVFIPSPLASELPWKFGYGPTVTLLVVVIVNLRPLRRRTVVQVGLLASVGALNLALGSRAPFLLCAVSAAFVLLARRRARPSHAGRLTARRRLWPVVTGLVIAAAVASVGYSYAAEQGWLGPKEMAKYATQSGGRYGVLLGGRVGVLTSSQAIIDSPVLGHGSWAKDWKYQNLLDRRLAELGYGGAPYTGVGVPPIPAHSYLLGAWVEGGLFGAVFWVWILLVIVACARSVYGRDDPYILLFAFAAASLAWSVLFSPFAAQDRLFGAYFLAVVMAFAHPQPLSQLPARSSRRGITSPGCQKELRFPSVTPPRQKDEA